MLLLCGTRHKHPDGDAGGDISARLRLGKKLSWAGVLAGASRGAPAQRSFVAAAMHRRLSMCRGAATPHLRYFVCSAAEPFPGELALGPLLLSCAETVGL
jgi:hypothetical protein